MQLARQKSLHAEVLWCCSMLSIQSAGAASAADSSRRLTGSLLIPALVKGRASFESQEVQLEAESSPRIRSNNDFAIGAQYVRVIFANHRQRCALHL